MRLDARSSVKLHAAGRQSKAVVSKAVLSSPSPQCRFNFLHDDAAAAATLVLSAIIDIHLLWATGCSSTGNGLVVGTDFADEAEEGVLNIDTALCGGLNVSAIKALGKCLSLCKSISCVA